MCSPCAAAGLEVEGFIGAQLFGSPAGPMDADWEYDDARAESGAVDLRVLQGERLQWFAEQADAVATSEPIQRTQTAKEENRGRGLAPESKMNPLAATYEPYLAAPVGGNDDTDMSLPPHETRVHRRSKVIIDSHNQEVASERFPRVFDAENSTPPRATTPDTSTSAPNDETPDNKPGSSGVYFLRSCLSENFAEQRRRRLGRASKDFYARSERDEGWSWDRVTLASRMRRLSQ